MTELLVLFLMGVFYALGKHFGYKEGYDDGYEQGVDDWEGEYWGERNWGDKE